MMDPIHQIQIPSGRLLHLLGRFRRCVGLALAGLSFCLAGLALAGVALGKATPMSEVRVFFVDSLWMVVLGCCVALSHLEFRWSRVRLLGACLLLGAFVVYRLVSPDSSPLVRVLGLGLFSLWIGTEYGGVWLFHPPHHALARIIALGSVLAGLLFLLDQQGRLVLGYEPTTREFRVALPEAKTPFVEGVGVVQVEARSQRTRLRAWGVEPGVLVLQRMEGGLPFHQDTPGGGYPITALAFSESGNQLAVARRTAGGQSRMEIWRVHPGLPGKCPLARRQCSVILPGRTQALCFLPGGWGEILVATTLLQVRRFDVQTGEELAHFASPDASPAWGEVTRVSVASTGKVFAVSSTRRVCLWQTSPLQPLREIALSRTPRPQRPPEVTEVCFTEDGRALLVQQGTIRSRWEVYPSPWPLVLLAGGILFLLVGLVVTISPSVSRTSKSERFEGSKA